MRKTSYKINDIRMVIAPDSAGFRRGVRTTRMIANVRYTSALFVASGFAVFFGPFLLGMVARKMSIITPELPGTLGLSTVIGRVCMLRMAKYDSGLLLDSSCHIHNTGELFCALKLSLPTYVHDIVYHGQSFICPPVEGKCAEM